MNCLLNKICPDNLDRIVQQMAGLPLESADELEQVIKGIFQSALANAHYCETYADMVFALKSNYPTFPQSTPSSKPVTFARILLNTCQTEFESLSQAMEPFLEEVAAGGASEELIDRRKERLLASMRFMGHLFLRNLVSTRIVHMLVEGLIGEREDGFPESHMVECACELLTAIGYTLERTDSGRKLIRLAAIRMAKLKEAKSEGQPAFPKRIQFRIADLLDLVHGDWQQKLYREQAKTLEAVRLDAMKEWRHGSSGLAFSTTKAGSQPAYIAAELAREQMDQQISVLRVVSPPQHEPEEQLALEQEPEASPLVVGLGVDFDRSFVDGALQDYTDMRDAAILGRRWRLAAPTSAERARGALWMLEHGSRSESFAKHAACALVDLLTQSQLSWEQLSWALRVLVQPALREEGTTEFLFSFSDGERAAFCALVAQALRRGSFSAAVFHALPDRRDLAWQLLVDVLRLLAEDGDARVQLNAVGEFWDVLCALKSVPLEMSEQALFQQLVMSGVVDEDAAAELDLA